MASGALAAALTQNGVAVTQAAVLGASLPQDETLLQQAQALAAAAGSGAAAPAPAPSMCAPALARLVPAAERAWHAAPLCNNHHQQAGEQGCQALQGACGAPLTSLLGWPAP